MSFFKHLLIKKNLLNNNAFIWNSEKKTINTIQKINTINLDLLVCIERQKKTLLENTRNFSIGNFTNNALLWGTRGNGKSTLIKSVFATLKSEYNNLRLIQLKKNNIFDIEKIYQLIGKFFRYQKYYFYLIELILDYYICY